MAIVLGVTLPGEGNAPGILGDGCCGWCGSADSQGMTSGVKRRKQSAFWIERGFYLSRLGLLISFWACFGRGDNG